MEITRRSLEIGPIELFGITLNPTLHWYGLLIVIGILLSASVVAWLAQRDGDDSDHVWNGLVWVVLLGVIGARLWSVVFPAGDAGAERALSLDYLTDMQNGPLAIWSGGLSIFGAVLGGIIGVYFYARRHHIDNRLEWFDRAAITMPLAQAIGRWGNFLNQELYGKPTDLPWGIQIDNPIAPYTTDDRFHPLFLYESLWNLLLFGLLLFLWQRRRQIFQHGDFVLMYFFGYSLARFLLEFIRVEIPTVGELNVSQITTAVAGSISLLVLVGRHRLGRWQTESYAGDKVEYVPAHDETPEVKSASKSQKKKGNTVSIHKAKYGYMQERKPRSRK